tara:strand:+ start:612 stop:4946 length:4335 start_codon:yes stop_codon:yes gene_type:complete
MSGSHRLRALTLGSPSSALSRSGRFGGTGGAIEAPDDDNSYEYDPLAQLKAVVPYVIKLQRAFRLVRFVYRKFGPSLFVDKEGNASHGQIKFRGVFQHANWIRVTPSASVRRLIKLFDQHYKLPKPEVLLTVTGGAQDFQLAPDNQLAFDRGIVSIASSAKAWIFTSGSDAGVMKLVGAAVSRNDVKLPVIGILPWGATNGRDVLMTSKSQVANYPSVGLTASRAGVPLNPHHTHFVLVDDGREGAESWGTEIGLRAELEAACAQTKGTPIVQLVVQGGPGTLATVLSTAMAGHAIVVLADSGGAATAIHDYCTDGIMAVDERFRHLEDQFKMIKQLNDAYQGHLLNFFSLREDLKESSDLKECLLQAIISMIDTIPDQSLLPEGAASKGARSVHHDTDDLRIQENMRRTLRLTVTWDEPALARKILSSARLGEDGKEVGTLRCVGETLQLALELQRARIVQVITELPGFTTVALNMGRLWLMRDTSGYLTENRMLQSRIRAKQGEMISNATTLKGMKARYAVYQRVLSKFFWVISPVLMRLVKKSNLPQTHDVFFWLVCHGNEEIARAIWPHCARPVHVALLGAAISKRMARDLVHPASNQALERAERLQEWALGALETADEERAYKVLRMQIDGNIMRPNSCLDIARLTSAKMFLTQRHCVSLMSLQWRGGQPGSSVTIRKSFNYIELLIFAVFPVVNRYLWKHDGGGRCCSRGRQRQKAEAQTATESIIMALGLVYRIVGEERGKVIKRDAMKEMRRTSMQSMGQSRSLLEEVQDPQAVKDKWITELFGAQASLEEEVNMVASHMTSFYQVPAVKYTLRFLMHCIAISFYVLLIINFVDPDELEKRRFRCEDAAQTPADDRLNCLANKYVPLVSDYNYDEVAWLLMELGLWLDQRYQFVARTQLKLPSVRGAGRFAWASDVLIIISVALRYSMEQVSSRISEPGFDGSEDDELSRTLEIYKAYKIIISLKTILIFLQTLPYLAVYRPLGVLVIVVTEMLGDVVNFSILFATITMAFMLGFMGLQSAGSFSGHVEVEKYHAFGVGGAFWSPLWSVFGEFDPDQYDGVASVVLWIYLFLSAIILVNLLVAQFSDTFQKVQKFAEQEYIFLSFDRLSDYTHVFLAQPPLLSGPYILLYLTALGLQWLCDKCCCLAQGRAGTAVSQSVIGFLESVQINSRGDIANSNKDEDVPEETSIEPNILEKTTSKIIEKSMVLASAKPEKSNGKPASTDDTSPKGEKRGSIFGGGSIANGLRGSTGSTKSGLDASVLTQIQVPSNGSIHVDIQEGEEDAADQAAKHEFDGGTMAEAYLTFKKAKDKETIDARTDLIRDGISSSQRFLYNEFSEMKSRFGKMETWLDESMSQRERDRREQTGKLMRLETQLGQVLTAMGIEAAEPAPLPDESKVRVRRRKKRMGATPSAVTLNTSLSPLPVRSNFSPGRSRW